MRTGKKERILSEKVVFEGRKFDICLRPDADESVVAEIFRWREYKAAEDIIRKSMLPIVDAGAHIGIFSLYASALNPDAKIYALEPEKENFALLLRNISKNRLDNVRTMKTALAAVTEKRELAIAADSINHCLRTGTGTASAAERYEKVSAVSLSDFLRSEHLDAVGLMKMDIEGGEYEVFESMTPEDFLRIHALILEYHEYGGRSRRELEKIFRSQGFSVETFPSRFEKGLGFMLARNKRAAG